MGGQQPLFSGTLVLEGLEHPHSYHDVMVILGGRLGSGGTCGMLERPLEGQRFAPGCLIFPKRG
jgi:hypothetical protein